MAGTDPADAATAEADAHKTDYAAGLTKDALKGVRIGVLRDELKADLNAYLATTPAAVKTRTLGDLISFNTANAAKEMPLFKQELFEDAEKTKGLSDPDYVAALAKDRSSPGADRSPVEGQQCCAPGGSDLCAGLAFRSGLSRCL